MLPLLKTLRDEGRTVAEITDVLNQRGYQTTAKCGFLHVLLCGGCSRAILVLSMQVAGGQREPNNMLLSAAEFDLRGFCFSVKLEPPLLRVRADVGEVPKNVVALSVGSQRKSWRPCGSEEPWRC